MKKLILIAVFLASSVLAGNKFQGALSIEQICAKGYEFIAAGPSGDGKQVRWMFRRGNYNGIPIVVDVGEHPSQAELNIASIAAVAEARFIYQFLNSEPEQKSPKLHY
jgi:hypothetical protein